MFSQFIIKLTQEATIKELHSVIDCNKWIYSQHGHVEYRAGRTWSYNINISAEEVERALAKRNVTHYIILKA